MLFGSIGSVFGCCVFFIFVVRKVVEICIMDVIGVLEGIFIGFG